MFAEIVFVADTAIFGIYFSDRIVLQPIYRVSKIVRSLNLPNKNINIVNNLNIRTLCLKPA